MRPQGAQGSPSDTWRAYVSWLEFLRPASSQNFVLLRHGVRYVCVRFLYCR